MEEHHIGLSVQLYSDDETLELYISFPPSKIHLNVVNTTNTGETLDLMESNQLPKVQEWSRIEISHMQEGGKYFLSLSVGGNELGRKELGPILPILTANIYIGDNMDLCQPGFIRGVLVLDKP